MDPREIALDSAPECRRIASRRMVSVVRSAHLENAVTEPPSTLEEEAPAAVARIDRTLRNFVPRCGPTRSAEHRGNEHAIIPRAPIGVPLESAATFGTALTPQQHQHRQERARLENSRVKKWLSMLARPRENPRNKDLLKKRCRKGIPDSIRGTAWFYLVDGAQLRAAHEKEFTYDDLLGLQLPLAFIESADVAASLAQPGAPSTSSNAASITSGAGSGTALAAPPPLVVDYEPMPPPSTSEVGRPILAFPESTASLLEVIERDINRTFPSHGLFAETGGVGQVALFRILACYLHLDREIGYCQGMGFLAAMLLCYMPEEDAFWSFYSIMLGGDSRHNVRLMFASGLPRLPVVSHVLQGAMNRALPRVAEKLLRFHVHPSMYATQWFMTLFTYTLPFDAAVRVWDAFLCEGWKAVFRASLALLRALEPRLVAAKDFEQTVLAFKRLGEPGFVHPDALGLVSGPTRLRQKELKALEVEHALLEAAGLPTADAKAGTWPRDAAAAARVMRAAGAATTT